MSLGILILIMTLVFLLGMCSAALMGRKALLNHFREQRKYAELPIRVRLIEIRVDYLIDLLDRGAVLGQAIRFMSTRRTPETCNEKNKRSKY